MDKFPKKYDYKKSTKEKQNQIWKAISSPFIPMDQKINPWVIFSNYYKDMSARWWKILWEDYFLDLWFCLSSQYYSNLSKWKKLTWIAKNIKSNKNFLDKIGLSYANINKTQIGTEEFNCYLRNAFANIYEKKIFVKNETTLWSNDFQTNMPSFNVTKNEKEITEYTLKYFIESKWFAISVITTDLTTIFGDVALAVNPIDKRYKKMIWQNVIIPIINKCIPIIWDDSVDVFVWSGVQRVTPSHDAWSLKIAEKHKLPINVYAINTDWTFSENAGMFAGKSLADFSENIEKYIDDIWNLTSTRITPWYEYLNSYTWELLYHLTLSQWCLSYDYSLDYLHQLVEDDVISIYPIEKKDEILKFLNNKNQINISNKSSKWLLIPVCYDDKWNSFAISDEVISENYINQKSKKDLILTLIVFNLIADCKLSTQFTVEELIDALYARDFLWETTKIQKYLEIYEWKTDIDSVYKNWLKSIKSLITKFEKDFENIDDLTAALQDSFGIKLEEDKFSIDFSEIFWSKQTLCLQTNDCFNKAFLDSVWFAYKNQLRFNDGPYNEITALNTNILSSIDDIDLLIDTLLFGLDYGRTILFNNIKFHTNIVDFKWNKITNFNSKYLTQDFYENLNSYWPDIMRLTLLFGEKFKNSENIVFDTYAVRDYNLLINKIWNANRYVYTKYAQDLEKIKIVDLLHNISNDISDCDNWLLHNIKSFLDDLQYHLKDQNYIDLWKNIFKFYKNVICEKYLQASKISFSENTGNITLLAFAIFNKLIEPYIPNFVTSVNEYFNFDWDNCKLFDLSSIELNERNYKVNIFMDIIDKFNELKIAQQIAQHENSDLIIQANPDFLDFVQENNDLLNALFNVWEIEYIWSNVEIPDNYNTWNVININLGLKKSAKVCVTEKNILNSLIEEYNEKNEYLEHLKWLLSSAYASCPMELLEKKKEKIRILQQELEDLNYKIRALKAK